MANASDKHPAQAGEDSQAAQMEFPAEYFEFIAKNRTADPNVLRLKFHGDPRAWLPYAINNIGALRSRSKFITIDGRDFTPRIIPIELSAQQSTSANIARLHTELAGNARTILDMTMGLGMDVRMMSLVPKRRIMGFELNPILAAAARINFEDSPAVEIVCGNSVDFIRDYSGEPFDLIFIDPARRGDQGQRLFNLHDCTPDLIELLATLREKSSRIMAKLSPMLDVSQTIRDLPGIEELHVVEEQNECKELLAIITGSNRHSDDSQPTIGDQPVVDNQSITDDKLAHSDIPIFIDRISASGIDQFRFTAAEESAATETILGRAPLPGEILLEPSPAAMKAGAFSLYSERFNAKKLHANTNLYIRSTSSPSFPGRQFIIEGVYPLTSSNLKTLGRKISPVNITTRNLPSFPPDLLARKMKIKQGGIRRLFAVTLTTPSGAAPYLLLASPL